MSPIKIGLLFIFINFIFISLSIANHSNQTNAISNQNRYRRSINFVLTTLAGNLVGKTASKIMDKVVCEKLNPEKIYIPNQLIIKLYCKYLRDADESAVINEKLDNIQNDLKSMSSSIAQMEQTLRDLGNKISEMSNILPTLTDFTIIRKKIQSKISVLNKYKELDGSLMNTTIKEFQKDVSGYRTDSMPDLMRRFHDTLFDDNAKLFKHFCKGIISNTEKNSTHNRLYQFYLSLMSFEVQSILAFSYKLELLKILAHEGHTTEKRVFQNDADERMQRLKKEFKSMLDKEDRTLYNLDPKRHVRGETYVAITRFHQFFIGNEDFFYTCSDTCDDFKSERRTYAATHSMISFNDSKTFTSTYNQQQNCDGTLYDCHYLDNCNKNYYGNLADPSSHMRYSRMDMYRDRSSRCVWEKHGKVGEPGAAMSFKNWWRGVFRCDACACTCDEPDSSKTVRWISLSEQTADVSYNYVITGIRFIERNQIIYLQIQQSKLLPGGMIDKTTSKWKSPSNSGGRQVYLDTTILMGKAQAPSSNSVLTGVKIYGRTYEDLRLGLEFSSINFEQGKVMQRNSWQNAVCSQCDTYSSKKDNPTIHFDNKPNGKDGFYYFVQSSLESDVGQTTVPFFDAQPVTTSFAPIAGVDFHVRDNKKSGGFISFKLTTLNYANLI